MAISNHDTGSVVIHGLLPLQVYCVCHGLERMRTRGPMIGRHKHKIPMLCAVAFRKSKVPVSTRGNMDLAFHVSNMRRAGDMPCPLEVQTTSGANRASRSTHGTATARPPAKLVPCNPISSKPADRTAAVSVLPVMCRRGFPTDCTAQIQ